MPKCEANEDVKRNIKKEPHSEDEDSDNVRNSSNANDSLESPTLMDQSMSPVAATSTNLPNNPSTCNIDSSPPTRQAPGWSDF